MKVYSNPEMRRKAKMYSNRGVSAGNTKLIRELGTSVKRGRNRDVENFLALLVRCFFPSLNLVCCVVIKRDYSFMTVLLLTQKITEQNSKIEC